MLTPTFEVVDTEGHATWADARKLVDKVRAGGRAWLQLGLVLEQLRAEYFAQGGSGRFGSPHRAANREESPSPHGAAKVPDERGWQAKVRDELGISDDTARRWMLDGRRYGQLLQIAQGEVSTVEDRKVTAAVRGQAIKAIEEIQLDPSVRPARVWAGVWGAGATKGKQRAAVDHSRNLFRAIKALQTSLPHWSELPIDERALLETEFSAVVHLLKGRLVP